MSTVSIGGLVTGLDTQSIISQLMNLERAPQKLLKAQQKTNTQKIGSYQKIGDALSELQTTVRGLNTRDGFGVFKATASNAAVLTAGATGNTAPGIHSIQVLSLARNQRQVTTGVASSTAAVFNTGSFTIDGTTTVTIGEGQNTLQGLVSAINASGANVTASIINDGLSYRMVIGGTDTADHTFDFSGLTTPPEGGTGPLVPDIILPGDSGYVEGIYQPASRARLVVDGIEMYKDSNTITDAIQGVTLNLLAEGASTDLTIAKDTDGIREKVNKFIEAYNKVVTLINSESAYNAETKTAGVLSGDSTIRSVQQQLRSLLTATVPGTGGAINSLASMGIKSDSKTGTLSLDSARFADALDNHYSEVLECFTRNTGSYASLPVSEYGIAEQFNRIIETMVHPYVTDGMPDNGLIEVRKKGLSKANADIDKRIDAMEERITQMQASLQKQFNAMESLVSSLQTQGTTLLNYLSSLNK